MFHIYEQNYRITSEPVSYNHLLKLFNAIGIPWAKISSMPVGEHISFNEFKIVRTL